MRRIARRMEVKNGGIAAVKWPDNRAWLFDMGKDMPMPEAYNRAIYPWKSQFMGCKIEKVILPRWKQNSVHFFTPFFENEKAADIVVCDSACLADDDFVSFVHALKKKMDFKHPGDTIPAADKCMCMVISGRNSISPEAAVAFILRVNHSSVFIPDAKGVRPGENMIDFKKLIIDKNGNFK